MMNLQELKIELTETCLLNCVHCSTDAKKNGAHIPFAAATNAIKQAASMGCSSVQLSGGEPFLDPFWQHYVRLIRDLGMQSTIYTSGIVSKYGDLPVGALKSDAPDKLIFSLYSCEPKIHNKITRKRKSFENTTFSIYQAMDLGIRVELHCVIMTTNMNHLDSLMEFAQSAGIDVVSFLRLVPQGRTNFHSNFLPDSRDYIKFRWIVQDLRNKYEKVRIRLGSPFNFLNLGHTPCSSGDKMVINSQGKAFPCDALKGADNPEPSSIQRYSLAEIMEKNEWFRIMRLKLNPSECDLCDHSKTCAGGCVAQKFYSYGIFSRDPACLKSCGEFLKRN